MPESPPIRSRRRARVVGSIPIADIGVTKPETAHCAVGHVRSLRDRVDRSDVELLGDLDRVIDFDAKIATGALGLRVVLARQQAIAADTIQELGVVLSRAWNMLPPGALPRRIASRVTSRPCESVSLIVRRD